MDIVTASLTNEKVSRRFTNQFDLVNYAIRLAAEMVHSGRAPRVKLNTENPALQILEEIAEGKDLYPNATPQKADKKKEVFSGGELSEVLIVEKVFSQS